VLAGRTRAVQAGLQNAHATRTIARRERLEVGERDALVDRVGALDPGVPAMTQGMPRAVHRRRSAPHGTPASATSRPSSTRSASRTSAANGWSAAVAPDANCPPAHAHDGVGHAAATRGLDARAGRAGVLAHAHGRAALEDEPVGHAARPLARPEAPDEQRVWAAPSARMSGCSTEAVQRALVGGERSVEPARSGRIAETPSSRCAAWAATPRDDALERSSRRPARRRRRSCRLRG
jgi:hypothetical protein